MASQRVTAAAISDPVPTGASRRRQSTKPCITQPDDGDDRPVGHDGDALDDADATRSSDDADSSADDTDESMVMMLLQVQLLHPNRYDETPSSSHISSLLR